MSRTSSKDGDVYLGFVYFHWFSTARGKSTNIYFYIYSLLIYYVCGCKEVANELDRWGLVALHH